jgi:drug/metabolite transporter (DMT)-like permease
VSIDIYIAALAAAVVWGIDPVLSKRGMAHGGHALQAAFAVITIGTIIFWSALLITQGIDAIFSISPRTALIFLGGGILGTTLGRISFYIGIDKVGASIAGIGASTLPAFAAILALVFLSEPLSTIHSIGIFLVVVGLSLLAISKGGNISGWSFQDLVLPVFAGFAFGLGQVIRRFGLVETPATVLQAIALNDAAAFLGLFLFLFFFRRDLLRLPSLPATGYFAAAGIVSSLGLFLAFTALNLGRVAIVSTLISTAGLFTVLLSFLFLRDLERITKKMITGAIFIAFGAGIVIYF